MSRPLIAILLLVGAGSAFHSAAAGALCPVSPDRDLTSMTSSESLFNAALCDPYSIGVQTYIWGFPIVEAAKIRLFLTNPDDPFATRPSSLAGAALNRFGHARVLADPNNLSGVGPNNDTLYSNAIFDLSEGPFVVDMPDFGDRYYTFSIAHPDSTTSQSIGKRTHGSKLPRLFLRKDDYSGSVPGGVMEIVSRDRYLMIFGRVLVKAGDDLTEVHALQDAIHVQRFGDERLVPVGPPPVEEKLPAIVPGDPLIFLQQLGTALVGMALPLQDHGLVDRVREIIEICQGSEVNRLTAPERAELSRGLADGKQIVEHASRSFGKGVHGWRINYGGPRFGTDYLLRAAVAKDQIYVTVPEEAVYPIARLDSQGRPLSGDHDYLWRITTRPPVRAFWSITMYNDKGAMVDNPLKRYSIGDRTPALKYGTDGSLMVRLSQKQPKRSDENWLPAPNGPFYLMMRLYLPDAGIFEGKWVPPPIERIGSFPP